jgi:hypothetical protein
MKPVSHLPARVAGLAVLGALSSTTPTLASGPSHDSGLRLDAMSFRSSADQSARERGRFGAAGSEHWILTTGVAHNFIDAWDFNLRGGYSQFLIDDVEFSFEVNGWYFSQDGEDALGINPAIAFRWHLIHLPERPWTIFTDVGIGVLLATDKVPAGGTVLDFTPRIGAGYTREIRDDGTRLIIGANWHHISNARIIGDRRNPSRDGLTIYGGVMIPF